RRQFSLSGYRTNDVRLRFMTGSNPGYNPIVDVQIDNISVAELPVGVVLQPITPLSTSKLQLDWSAYTNSDFKSYRIFRSTGVGVTESSTLLATLTNSSTTTWTNKLLPARQLYYYKVFVYNTNDTSVGSNETSGRTLGIPVGTHDSFTAISNTWTYSGTWTILAGVGPDGSPALVDSAGDYLNSSDNAIQTAVDLTGTQWPVVRFKDHFNLGAGDYGWFEISTDQSNWSRRYQIRGARDTWSEHVVDLSEWKTQSSVYLRFHFYSDGSVTGDGWYIDDFSVEDTVPVERTGGFYDGMENGMTNWIATMWYAATNSPYTGVLCARDSTEPTVHSSAYIMSPHARFDLSSTVSPKLTYWIKGSMNHWSAHWRVEGSVNGGVTWSAIDALDQWSGGWTKRQISLAGYRTNNVRFRAYVSADWGYAPAIDISIDNFGIGDATPSTPILLAPPNNQPVGILRPTLAVKNASDYQSDALNYRFEIYSDVNLSNLVAQVPSIAGGLTSTAWQVDTDLTDNSQYWWRCRASDASNSGPWMTTATFYTSETNAPPNAVTIAGPPKGAVMRNDTFTLSWYPTTDPDLSDTISLYHIQIDNNTDFSSPEVDDSNISIGSIPTGGYWAVARPLNSLAGNSNLVMITDYRWRIRARDSRYAWSAWTSGQHWFTFGIPAPDFNQGHMNTDGTITFEWDIGADNVYISFSPTLDPPDWQVIAGPLDSDNWTGTPPAEHPIGYYRVHGD
ncbi:MAG: immune inhibitor A, partial [Verrucomicrobia bacterium]|nr:immune inhibitor A [Verrucomicrobiota bacterium]